jgi:hypothetical protein
MELLESSCVRPTLARYQAALRPDMKYVKIIKHFPAEILFHSSNSAVNCTETVPNRLRCTIAVPEPSGFSWASLDS